MVEQPADRTTTNDKTKTDNSAFIITSLLIGKSLYTYI